MTLKLDTTDMNVKPGIVRVRASVIFVTLSTMRIFRSNVYLLGEQTNSKTIARQSPADHGAIFKDYLAKLESPGRAYPPGLSNLMKG